MGRLYVVGCVASLFAFLCLSNDTQGNEGMGNSIQLPAREPARVLLQPPQFGSAIISPDGTRIASVDRIGSIPSLVMTDVASGERKTLVRYGDTDIFRTFWIDNDRLFAAANAHYWSQLDAADREGLIVQTANGRALHFMPPMLAEARRSGVAGLQVGSRWSVADGFLQICYQQYEPGGLKCSLYDTANHTERSITNMLPPGRVSQYVLDKDGKARLVVSCMDCETKDATASPRTVWWLWHDTETAWRKVRDVTGKESCKEICPEAATADHIYVLAKNVDGRRALFEYDLAKQAPGRLIYEHAQHSVKRVLFDDTAELVRSVRLDDPLESTVWLDTEFQAIQKVVDAALPGKRNELRFQLRSTNPILVRSGSDNDPGTLYLFDRRTSTLKSVGAERPWIADGRYGQRTRVEFAAKDGTMRSALLTVPKGIRSRAPLLAIMPNSMDLSDYLLPNSVAYARAQFFASRGYAVIEPTPRLPQTGQSAVDLTQSFQEDVLDALAYVASNDKVDVSRACLVGLGESGMGGYLAMSSIGTAAWRCVIAENAPDRLREKGGWTWEKRLLKESPASGEQLSDRLVKGPLVPIFLSYEADSNSDLKASAKRLAGVWKEKSVVMTDRWSTISSSARDRNDSYASLFEDMERFLAKHLPTSP